MPNLNQVFREEISRLARREVKQIVEPLQKQIRDLRGKVRKQRRELEKLEKELAGKADKERVIAPRTVSEEDDVRIHKGSVKKHRERLGISQREMALLLDVSPLTISNWETDKSSPSGKNRLAFAELRGMGVREVWQRLEMIE